MVPEASLNPFPGLRPFEPDEDHLFFGRETEIDELLRRLRTTRFLSVVGASGSGKSSLVRSGLIPALHGGFMANAGSHWRIAILRPGENPIGHLAAALDAHAVLPHPEEPAGLGRVLLDATLRRSSLGLVEAVREARVSVHDNILVVVDQFEELFRFRRSGDMETSHAEAAAFVKLLLEAAGQDAVPVFIVLTMRSDFIGDCMQFAGLPEAVNAGVYLVPRMSRDELRSAITGPVAVGGGFIAPRLVVRLLNEMGDAAGQLPVLQHALMRTWAQWRANHASDRPIDIVDYEAIGTMRHALSQHAEEAYAEAGSDLLRRTVERIFKALTDTSTDPRGTRRPTSIGELAAICEGRENDVIAMVELFRRSGRSFLMPPAGVPLETSTIVDLSHESLMRCWDRLMGWAEEERVSARLYIRLSQAAAWHAAGAAGLWRDPELELGLQWRRNNSPSAAWAARYDPSFDGALAFLDLSRSERDRLIAERESERKRKLHQAQWTAAVLGALLLAVGIAAGIARSERNLAQSNLAMAKQAVDELLLSAGTDSARVAAEVPQMEAFRKELLDKARKFYIRFTEQQPRNEAIRREMAVAHRSLGDIDRLLQQNREAAAEYRTAISEFQSLAHDYPSRPEYRVMLADVYNWLGESERVLEGGSASAGKAYDSAVYIQEELLRSDPAAAGYRQGLARTLYNRGILRSSTGHSSEAETDYREAIRLLDGLPDSPSRQGLARTYNDLAMLLESGQTPVEARPYYQRAIAIHEALLNQDPANRDYAMELALFYNNLASLLEGSKDYALSMEDNGKAIQLLEDLSSPAPTFAIELGHAYTLRGQTLEHEGAREVAGRQFELAIGMFAKLGRDPSSRQRSDFHLHYGEALLSLAVVRFFDRNYQLARSLLSQAEAEVRELPEEQRSQLDQSAQQLQKRLEALNRPGLNSHQ